MEQDGRLAALALSAFSVPWLAQEVCRAADAAGCARPTPRGWPAPRYRWARRSSPSTSCFSRERTPDRSPAPTPRWKSPAGSALTRRGRSTRSRSPSSATRSSPPMIRFSERVATPTVDLTIHFRATQPRTGPAEGDELCFARFRSGVVHEGFFEEDGVIWAPRRDGARTVAPAGGGYPVHPV